MPFVDGSFTDSSQDLDTGVILLRYHVFHHLKKSQHPRGCDGEPTGLGHSFLHSHQTDSQAAKTDPKTYIPEGFLEIKPAPCGQYPYFSRCFGCFVPDVLPSLFNSVADIVVSRCRYSFLHYVAPSPYVLTMAPDMPGVCFVRRFCGISSCTSWMPVILDICGRPQ